MEGSGSQLSGKLPQLSSHKYNRGDRNRAHPSGTFASVVAKAVWVQTLALLLTSCVTLSMSLNLSVPIFSHNIEMGGAGGGEAKTQLSVSIPLKPDDPCVFYPKCR